MLQYDKQPLNSNFVLSVLQLTATNVIRINTKCDAGAFLVEAGDFAAVACWQPPECTGVAGFGQDADQIEREGRVAFAEFLRGVSERKKVTFSGEERYWQLSLMAREPGRKEKGVVRAVMEWGLERARREGCRVWVEAGSGRARDVYGWFGFRVVEELRIGRGVFDGEGRRREGGEGVGTWLMAREWTEEEKERGN